jgi:hypothetical protein
MLRRVLLVRRLLTFALSLTASATVLVALPTITTGATAAPRPVQAGLQQVRLTGPVPGDLRSPLITGRRFSLMGVTWAPDADVDELDVEVRTRTGGRWSAWEHVEAHGDDAPDAGTDDTGRRLRSGTAPIWTGPSDGVQVTVRTVSGEAPRDVKIELVDPGTSPADRIPAVPRDTASAAATQPEILTRAQWGADESIRRGSSDLLQTVKVGFVHHTASSNDYSPDQAAAMVRGIYAYHVKSNGWSDIGYNILVDRYGRAYEGRAGSIERHVLGAHTGGFNVDSFGVSLLGDFSTVPPSDTTMATLSKVLAWKLGAAYRDPRGKAVLTSAGGGTSKFPAGRQVTFDVVSGHRDAGSTSCPGATTYARLPALRSSVAADLGPNLVDPVVSGPTSLPVGSTGPLVLRAGTLQGLPWTASVTDSSGALLRAASGTGGQASLRWDLTDAAGRPVKPGTYALRITGGAPGVVPYVRTVVVGDPPCQGGPLTRAKCQTKIRTARR